MILVASPSKPFDINPTKHTAVRSKVTAAYDEEINDAYIDFERNTGSMFAPPPSWNVEDCLPFVRAVVLNTLPNVPSDEEDLFNVGCDRYVREQIYSQLCLTLRQLEGRSDPQQRHQRSARNEQPEERTPG